MKLVIEGEIFRVLRFEKILNNFKDLIIQEYLFKKEVLENPRICKSKDTM